MHPLVVARREATEETGLDDLVFWPDERIVHLAIVPVPAAGDEPAHEHADVRFVLAPEHPAQVRPENPTAALRWLTVPRARFTATDANVLVTLDRVEELFHRDLPLS